jgi:hypothetical protein
MGRTRAAPPIRSDLCQNHAFVDLDHPIVGFVPMITRRGSAAPRSACHRTPAPTRRSGNPATWHGRQGKGFGGRASSGEQHPVPVDRIDSSTYPYVDGRDPT